MANFTRFKRDVLKVIDHALENEVYLDEYVKYGDQDVCKMNESHICNSPACLEGYLPEVFPKRFEWVAGESVILVRSVDGSHRLASVALGAPACPSYYNLDKIFAVNHSHDIPDILVVQTRRKMIEESISFKHLLKLIYNNDRWF